MQNTCKETLYSFIEKGELENAFSFVMQNIKEHQNEEYFVLFYILLNIWKEECHADVSDIFSSPIGRNPEKLLTHYTQIKLYLRRFEYQMSDEILQEAFDYFTLMKVSPHALYRIANFACVKPVTAFQELSKFYKKNGNIETASLFYQAATPEQA